MLQKRHALVRQFGNRLRKLRENKNLSQEKLAELAGVHRTYIGMIERGEKNLTLLNLGKLSTALNLSIAELLKGIDNPAREKIAIRIKD
jgi:transcriptional regulator with XRE-family HTH domain